MTKLCPICIDELIYVDYGPKLRYFYCRNCKKELSELNKQAEEIREQEQIDRLKNDYDPYW